MENSDINIEQFVLLCQENALELHLPIESNNDNN